ncbi:hypothetical protein AC578_5202 [Pseudocercospora eumusae]|uniref:HTH myb-type domain-containing protein n=1 Tax=Pseudocercospora eumusae TaxID=321146 RepID=A0A139H0C2_9PEZI|nr:hypothetical protein AC578_5202 [Pseudocercospora eumusae]
MSLFWKSISRSTVRHAVPNASRWMSSSGTTVRAWTKEEDHMLLQLRELGVPYKQIADRLGRSYPAVGSRAHDLRRSAQRSKRHHSCDTQKSWSEEETSTLKNLRAEGKRWKEIASVLGRSVPSVFTAFERRVGRKGLCLADSSRTTEDDAKLMAMRTSGSSLLDARVPRPAPSWLFTKEEDELLLRLKVDEKKSWHQIHQAFKGSRGLLALEGRFTNLQTKTLSDRLPRHREPWTENDIAKLRQLVDSSTPRKSIALQLGRSFSAVRRAIETHVVKEGRSSAVPWSPEEDAILLHHRRDLHKSFPEIAADVGRTASACFLRYSKVLRYRFPESPGESTGNNEHVALNDKSTTLDKSGS